MTTENQAPAQNPNQAIEKRPKSAALEIKEWMSAPSMQKALRAALAGYMDETTFAAQCYLAAQDPKLAGCSAASLFRAFLECAQMGLLPGAHHKHVALVPRWSKEVNANVITSVPQWQGFKFLMERQPGVVRVTPVLVHTKDKFAWTNGELVHEYDPFDDTRVFEHPSVAEKANRACMLKGGYLVLEREGRPAEYHFVSRAKIDRNRLCAETQVIWQKWFPEMVCKTLYRDAWAKRIVSIDPQLAERIGRADAMDNVALGNDPARGGDTPQLPAGGPAVSRTQQLAARVAGPAASVTGDEALPDIANEVRAASESESDDANGENGVTVPTDPLIAASAEFDRALAEGRVIRDGAEARIFATKELADAAREADAHAKHVDAQLAPKDPPPKSAPAIKSAGLNLGTKGGVKS